MWSHIVLGTDLLYPLSIVDDGHVNSEPIFKRNHSLLVVERKLFDISRSHKTTERPAQGTAEVVELCAPKLRVPALGLPIAQRRLEHFVI